MWALYLGSSENQTEVVTITVVPTSPGSYVNVASHSDIRVEEPFEVREPAPADKENCKKGGYKLFGFRNQGQCIKAVNQSELSSKVSEHGYSEGPRRIYAWALSMALIHRSAHKPNSRKFA